MKKLIIAFEIMILIILLVKIATVVGIIRNSENADRCLSVSAALADSSNTVLPESYVRDVGTDSLQRERELSASLLAQQGELKARENFIKEEEKNLISLKNEILSRINELRETEGRLEILVGRIKAVDDKKYKDLARVYEASPPQQASAMLEKLDKKTAAAIIMNMKSKKAGAIWGYMAPRKAVEITEEITHMQLSSTGGNTR